MQIEIFCLCNDIRAVRNQYSVIGCFDTLWAKGEPVMVGPFFVAVAIRFYRKGRGNRTLTVFCRDKDGASLLPSVPDTRAILDFPNESTVLFYPCAMGRTGLKFGSYQFSIECDGKQLAHTPLYVVRESTSSGLSA
jgi:hypothetical protein